jgi:hypothetical protein
MPCDILDNEPGADNEKLMNLYQKYGFKVWFKQLGGVESSVTTPVVKSMTLPSESVSKSKTKRLHALRRLTKVSKLSCVNTVFCVYSFNQSETRIVCGGHIC